MEAKIQLSCQEEEDIDVVDAGTCSFARNMPSKNVYSKKYIKFSKMIEKKMSPLISPEIRCLSPKHKKMYEASIFLCEEKYSDKMRRKKSLQMQSKRTEIISPSVKLSKQKIIKKENTSDKLPNQYRVHRTSSPGRKDSITGKNEALSNLYQTWYDEVPYGNVYSQELNGLQKAYILFSKVRNGKIYVNDLSMILRTLEISVNDLEMRQALKTIEVDGNGLLDFSNFLKALNDVSYSVPQDPAFQDALKIFYRIKDGQVATDELALVLSSMNIFVDPETVQEMIKCTFVDSNNMVDMGNIIFMLNELYQDYEEVSVTEKSELAETTSVRKLSKLSRYSLQYTKSGRVPSRLSETSITQKLNRKSLQHHSKIMENNDNLDFKSVRNAQQIKTIVQEVGNRHVVSQEPHPKDGMNLRKPSNKSEMHDLKYKPQSLKSISNIRKSLDKSDISGIPKLKKPDLRRRSSLLKQISSKEKTTIGTLGVEKVCEAVHKLKENFISAEELQSILLSVGIILSDQEFQKILTDTTRNEHEMVNLGDFVIALAKERNLPTCAVLLVVIKTIDKIKDEYVDCEDLNTCLQNFGVYLSKSEFEKVKDLTLVDDMKKVNFKEFIDNMMKNTERFSEKLLLHDAIETLNSFSKEKMNVSDLWNILSSLNSNLKKDEFLAVLELAPVDEGDKVQFEEFAEVAKHLHDASRSEELKGAMSALNLLEGDMIAKKNLEDFLRNFGIKLPQEEVEKILQSDFVSEDNMVNIKDCLRALKGTQKFSNFMALNDAINTLDFMKESYQSDKGQHSDALESTDRACFTDESLQEILNDSCVEEFRKEVVSSGLKFPNENAIKETAYILSHVDNGRINIPNLEHALKNLNINLTGEDVNEVLKCCDISDSEEVDLREFLTGLKEIPCFTKSIANQLLLATSQNLQNDLIDVSDLKASLLNKEFYGANAVLEEVLRQEPEHENGKMTIQEFLTKISSTLTVLNDAEDKMQFYNIDINKNEDTAVSELQQRLNALGISLTDGEIQMALENTKPNSDVVNFKDIIRELTNTDEFIECQGIEHAWKAVDTVSHGKVEVKDILSTLESPEKPLNKDQHKALLNSAADSLFQEIATVEKIRNKKMPVNELSSRLLSTGLPLSSKTFKEILRQASIDENSEASLKEILETLNTSKPAAFEDIYTALNIVNLMNCDRIQINDLNDALGDLSVPLKPEEYKMLEKTLDVDEKRDISLKTALLVLKSNKRFQDFREVNQLAKALDKVTNEKVNVDDIKPILKGLEIYLPEEELEKVLTATAVDNKGNVVLKDFMTGLTQTPYFIKGSEIEGPLKVLASIRKSVINPDDLGAIMKNTGVPVPQDMIQRTLKNVAFKGDRIDVSSLDTFLGNMRMEMPGKQLNEIPKDLSLAVDKKVNKKKGIKDRRVSTGGKIDVSNVNSVLENMDIKLTEDEQRDLLEHVSATADEDLDMNTLKGIVKKLKEKTEVCNLDSLLDNIGLELTDKEQKELVNHLPANADGKISQLKLMNTVKMLKRGKVPIQNLSAVLENLGVKLTEKEFQNLQQHLSVEANEKVDLSTLLDEVKVLKDERRISQRKLIDTVEALKEGKVDVSNLNTFLENIGVKLSDKEFEELSHNLPVDREHYRYHHSPPRKGNSGLWIHDFSFPETLSFNLLKTVDMY